MMTRILFSAALILFFQLPFAHVGSPGVVFEGKAGPYGILVSVDPPDVIPGIAAVSIYIKEAGVETVSAKPVYWYVGDEGSPKADPIYPVEDVPGQYQGEVWFMQTGTASLSVHVKGELGEGETVVPIMAAATAQREMEAGLGWTLAGLGILLTVLMVTIIGSAVSDGLVRPGEDPDQKTKNRKWKGAVVAALVLGLILFGGKSWWEAEAASYQQYMYKAPGANSWVEPLGKDRILTFQIDSTTLSENRLPMGYLTPDHGKLMHMFIIKEGSMDVFAHLHPKRVDPLTFKVRLPEVPEGRYYVFGDIVRLNGYTETIADTVDIIAPPLTEFDSTSLVYDDPDNTYIVSNAFGEEEVKYDAPFENILICGRPGIETPLADGSIAVWDHQPGVDFEVGKVYPLTFGINDSTGQAAELEPYMGMMGHAVVFRKEGGVYVHLHPVGNYSMASQEIIEGRISENSNRPTIPEEEVFMDSVDRVVDWIAAMDEEERNDYLMKDMDHTGLGEHEDHGATVSFPYSFPQPGNYRIWIQMKKDGKVLNSSFDATVVEPYGS